MKAIAFDTLEIVKRLRAANFSEAQAEAMVEAIAAVVTEQLATKADLLEWRRDLEVKIETLRRDLGAEIESVRRELGAEIESVRRELGAEIESVRREIKESEYRLTIRLGGMLAAAVAVVAALVKLL
ncbi:MAG: coiled-coil domain-containing protein [Desulfobacca sp.]|uniref:coiled-coil domain-containing protein n=1 Tax=Desulfobacca sp. TaxID=2067990 RepID=UPI00404B3EF7